MNSFKDNLRPSKADLINSINEGYREDIMAVQMLLSWVVDDNAVEKARRKIAEIKSRLENDKRMFRGLDVIESDIFEKVADLEERLLQREKVEHDIGHSNQTESEQEESR